MFYRMTGKQNTKLRRHSALIRARSTGKRLRAIGSHSEISTAVGSGEAAQMLSAGVGVQKRRKTEIHNHRISFKFPERTRAVRSDRSYEGDIPSRKAKVKSRLNLDRQIQKGSGPLITALYGSGFGTLKCPNHLSMKTPKSRNVILRFNRNR
jgi:hypothetical protein